jgi:hypothetical protein
MLLPFRRARQSQLGKEPIIGSIGRLPARGIFEACRTELAWTFARIEPASGDKRDAVTHPPRIGDNAVIALEIRDVEKEARGFGDVCPDQPSGDLAGRQPPAAGTVQIDTNVRQRRQDRDGTA